MSYVQNATSGWKCMSSSGKTACHCSASSWWCLNDFPVFSWLCFIQFLWLCVSLCLPPLVSLIRLLNGSSCISGDGHTGGVRWRFKQWENGTARDRHRKTETERQSTRKSQQERDRDSERHWEIQRETDTLWERDRGSDRERETDREREEGSGGERQRQTDRERALGVGCCVVSLRDLFVPGVVAKFPRIAFFCCSIISALPLFLAKVCFWCSVAVR